MNREIIKNFKLKIYIIPILLTIHKIYKGYIIFIYLITFIVKKLSKKKIKENMKHKEKELKKTKWIHNLN